MIGSIVNAAAIVAGGLLGLLLKKGLPERVTGAVMTGLGLVVVYIGIDGALEGRNVLLTTIAIAIGGAVGSALDLDGHFSGLVHGLEQRFIKHTEGSTFGEGFITTTVLYCVGAMAVVGSLNSGLSGDHEVLFAKSLLDGISSILFASALGAGVLLSALPVLLYQGAITLLAQFIAPFLSDAVVAEMTCTGSLLLIAIGLNMMGVTKIKVMNYILAIFLPILLGMVIK